MLKRLFSILPGGVKHNYRSDIDGLRAIACLAVVLYHAFPDKLHGGFVGVDIFFVISGFLISSIIYRNLFNSENPGKVNIVDFYIRRVRRIFPALIAVLITTLVLGWFVLLPDEYKLLGKHVFGGSVYINNFMLFNESGDYFNVASNAKPLLHLWSLGVEEQFYLIFPIFLYVLYKTNLNFILCLTLFTVGSFCLNKYNINTNQQTSAFYLPWCRFWELSIGAILAYTVNYHSDFVLKAKSVLTDNIIASYASKIIFRKSNDDLRRNLINNAISLAGIVIIIFSIIAVKNDSTFPGTKACIPVFGSLMIIGAGKTAVINKYLLSNPVMVFIGLISYPLYLWHWPLLSLAYICEGQQPASWIRICAVLIAVILSVLTYFFIEPPLRYGKNPKIKAVLLFLVLLTIGICGYKVFSSKGIPSRFESNSKLSAEELSINQNRKKYGNPFLVFDTYIDNCKEIFPNWNDADPAVTCALQNKTGLNNIALLGSSKASQLFYGISELAQKDGNSVALFPMGYQSPFINLQTVLEGKEDWYKRINDGYDYILNHKNINSVVLSDITMDIIKDIEKPNITDYSEILSESVVRSLNLLKGKNVIIVLDNPWLPFDPKVCSGIRPFKLSPIQCSYNKESQKKYKYAIMHKSIIEKIAKHYDNVKVVDLNQFLCDKVQCGAVIDGKVMYLDDMHLNKYGSKLVAPFIYNQILEMMNKVIGKK